MPPYSFLPRWLYELNEVFNFILGILSYSYLASSSHATVTRRHLWQPYVDVPHPVENLKCLL